MPYIILISQAVDDICQGLQVRIDEEGVFVAETVIIVAQLHYVLGITQVNKGHAGIEVFQLAI